MSVIFIYVGGRNLVKTCFEPDAQIIMSLHKQAGSDNATILILIRCNVRH